MYFIHTPIFSSPDLAEPRWTRKLTLSCIRGTQEGSLLLDTLTWSKTGTFAGSQRHAVMWLLTAAGVPEHLLNVYSIIPGRGFFPELAANQSNPHLLQPLQDATKNCLYCTEEKLQHWAPDDPQSNAKGEKKNRKESKISARKTRKQQYHISWYKVFIWDFTINTKSSFQCLFIQSINLY